MPDDSGAGPAARPDHILLEAIAAEIEAYVGLAGWDLPPALFALVPTRLLAADPAAAAALGAVFLLEAHGLRRRARHSDDVAELRPMRLFHWSNMYLSLLFVAVALDPLLVR